MFQSPELLSSNQYDHSADSWALGVSFYYMIVGVYPFVAKTVYELASVVGKGDYYLPETV